MKQEQLELIKDTLKNVQPADDCWLPHTVQSNIHKSINAINRELRRLKEEEMGINLFKRSCSSSPYAIEDSNPDPEKFTILHEKYYNGFLVLVVRYPNCTNFEGKKVMVYEGFKNSKELIKHNNGKLDPHFANEEGSPIARFKPRTKYLKLIEAMIDANTILEKQKTTK